MELPSVRGHGETTNPFHSPDADDDGEGEHTTEEEIGEVLMVPMVLNANGSSMLRSVANLANTIVGSGMLALPHAYACCGFFLGSLLLCFFAVASAFGLHLLARCALRSGLPSTFRTVTSESLPGFASVIIDMTVSLKCFGVATSYLIVVSDVMPDVARALNPEAGAIFLERHFWIVMGMCIVGPLSFLRSMDRLAFTSILSLAFVSFLTLLVFVYSFLPEALVCGGKGNEDIGACVGDHTFARFDIETVSVLTVFVFGYTCHQNIVRTPPSHALPRPGPLLQIPSPSALFVLPQT